MNVFDKAPSVSKDAFVAPSASIIGDVQIGRASSIWYGCVLRGDVNHINVGSGTNIQDNSLVHVANFFFKGRKTISSSLSLSSNGVVHELSWFPY
ncbi:hypothetical protein MKW94_003805 [Papaver nudicaule]|uniref:Gamma carbonic anhydrase family protein n=1 Tax=Papaver nudicaule TaxID=74823 RepID=A0AA41VUG7_PAPNU|nr:hypothetical protein [Papaver nudicaule]